MSGKILILELGPEKLLANQIARFFLGTNFFTDNLPLLEWHTNQVGPRTRDPKWDPTRGTLPVGPYPWDPTCGTLPVGKVIRPFFYIQTLNN